MGTACPFSPKTLSIRSFYHQIALLYHDSPTEVTVKLVPGKRVAKNLFSSCFCGRNWSEEERFKADDHHSERWLPVFFTLDLAWAPLWVRVPVVSTRSDVDYRNFTHRKDFVSSSHHGYVVSLSSGSSQTWSLTQHNFPPATTPRENGTENVSGCWQQAGNRTAKCG